MTPALRIADKTKDSDHPGMLMCLKVEKYVMADEDRYQIVASCVVAKKRVAFYATCVFFEFGSEANDGKCYQCHVETLTGIRQA